MEKTMERMMYLWFQKNLSSFFEWSLKLFLFLLPWPTVWIVKKWELDTVVIFGFEILLFAIVLLFLTWYITNKKYRESAGTLMMVSSIFLGYCFLSTFWAPQPLVAFFQALRITEAFVLVALLLQGPFNRVTALITFIAGATIQSVLGIYQFVTQSTFAFKWLGLVSHPLLETGTSVVQSSEAGRHLRAYGAFAHPNVFGGYLVLSIVFTTLFLLRRKKKVFFLWVSVLSQCAALFFTWSRSAWIAAGAWFGGLMVWWFFKKVKKEKLLLTKKIPAICSFVCIFLITLSLFYLPLVKTRVQGESYHEVRSISERIAGPKFAFTLWQTSPVFGVGAGNYVPAMFDASVTEERWVYEPVHVVPVLMLTELGIVGFAVFLMIMFLFGKSTQFGYLQGLAVVSLIPLLLLDHYLYSIPEGILMGSVFLGLVPQFLHIFSPPQQKS